MTKEEVINMAHDAGVVDFLYSNHDLQDTYEFLQRFATLVATAERHKLQADIELCKAERQPLTKEQQFSVWSKLFGPNKDRLNSPYNSYIAYDSFYKVVVTIEAAHDITGGR